MLTPAWIDAIASATCSALAVILPRWFGKLAWGYSLIASAIISSLVAVFLPVNAYFTSVGVTSMSGIPNERIAPNTPTQTP